MMGMWGRSGPQVIVLYKPCYDGIIPMTLRDVYAYGKSGEDDYGWGCTYRVIQAMHRNILMEDPLPNLSAITDRIPGKSSEKNDWLEPIDAQHYFQSFANQNLPQNVDFKVYKYEKHQRWAKSPVR